MHEFGVRVGFGLTPNCSNCNTAETKRGSGVVFGAWQNRQTQRSRVKPPGLSAKAFGGNGGVGVLLNNIRFRRPFGEKNIDKKKKHG